MKRLLLAVIAAFLGAVTPALALNCSSYPYTLLNGQVADANQVMANFNSIRNCANTSLAHSGANSDITSLSGLTTPLSVAQGGTGSTTGSGAATNLGLLSKSGGTMTGRLVTAASTTLQAGLNVPQGVAPTSPQTGDLWVDNVSLNVFANGNSQRLLTAGAQLAPPNTTSAIQLPLSVANGILYWPFSTHILAITILTNAVVAFPISTTINVVIDCASAGATIALSGGVTMNLLNGSGGTGTRTLSACGQATLLKVGTDAWVIYGWGIT